MFSVLALAGSAAAYNATTTVESTAYVTIPCSSGQTLTYGSLTYTATEATTLTVKDCSCSNTVVSSSATPSVEASAFAPSSAVLANGAAAPAAAAAAGVAAAVAYLL